MSNYIVVSFANLHKSDIIGNICLNYLADIANKYKIDEYGDVLNFSKYQVISKSHRQKQLWTFKKHALAKEAQEAKLKQNEKAKTDKNGQVLGIKRLKIGEKVQKLLNTSTPDEKMHLSPSIENMSIDRALKQYRGHNSLLPTELLPTSKDCITIEGKQYLMKNLSLDERK